MPKCYLKELVYHSLDSEKSRYIYISSSLRQWLGPLDVWRTQSISRQLKSSPIISVLSTGRFVSVASTLISGLSPADGGGAIKAANVEVRLVTTSVKRSITAKTV